MALSLNDYILQATGGPSVPDGLYSWYGTNGGTGNSLQDRAMSFLISKGYTTGTLQDRWFAYLGSLGYTQNSLQDRFYAFWAAGGIISGFSPSELFQAGEVGVWYDPSDFSTLFENTDGTGAISTVEKPVGKMLDKSGNGFHATAANNSTARPVLRSRYNLLTYSEQFDNGVWGKNVAAVTANQEVAPDGTTTADKVANSTTTFDRPVILQSFTLSAAATVTQTVYAKVGSANFLSMATFDGTSTKFSGFNLSNGTVDVTAVGHTLSIVDAGGGWYRCSVTYAYPATTARTLFGVYKTSGTTSYSPSSIGADFIYAWGADARIGSSSGTYQRIAAATDYDTDATKFPPYLAFTTDDAMSTASIDFSGTDEMTVFAGVTKNADSGTVVISELSASSSSNSGSFAVFGSVVGGDKYRYRSGGSAYFDAVTASSVYSAPTTNVLTGLSDISLDSVVLRLDGSEIDANTGDQGSGNYGNYPLYIGARDNSSSFFNGSLYSLIVRGKTSTATEIDDTEAWVANKTGVTL